MTKIGTENVNKASEEGNCLNCDRSQEIRGVCNPCYQSIRRLIKAGETSEEQLIRDGKLLSKKSGGRPPSNPVTLSVRDE